MSESSIKFKLNKSKTEIYACYSLCKPNLLEIDRDWVINQLNAKGLGDYIIIKDKIDELIQLVSRTEEGSGKIRIAGSKDAKVIIDVIDDMSACMTIIPPKGGRPVSLDMVKKALAEKGIRHGFLLDEIRVAIVSGKADKAIIAQAEPPINGKDAKFICTLPEVKIRTQRHSEKGRTSQAIPGDYTVVEQGESVMQRIPATEGVSSKNIFGEVLKPVPGEDTPFAAGLKGVTVSEDDPNMLIAIDSGQPTIVKNGIYIEKTMSVKNVDLSTGNVIFEGSVIVTGDVASGMIVHANKDITVRGMVESAILDAGGNILVRGAVVGREEKQTKDSKTALLKANGSITAKFVENASLESNSNIYIQDWVLRSELTAVNEIIVGSANSSKGQIIGGKIYSGVLVKAIKLGSSAGVETDIVVGKTDDANDSTPSKTANTKREKILQEINKKIDFLTNDTS
ncbi:MAG TPA: DUF342 domain-containing protein, partial [Gammaproteobacteria bacterium]|nr:DUF342 domain-containing protein [Gammaproteobacteria bacterium]